MIKKLAFTGLALAGMLGLALAVGAQSPGPRGGFGPGGPAGPDGPGDGPGGGRGSAACTPSCPQYQFTYTRKSVQPVLLAGGPSTVTNTTSGTIAGDQYGSTYRDVTLSEWGSSQSSPEEFIYVRDLDPGVMMNYIVNVTKGSYEQFPIQLRTPRGGGSPPPNFNGLGPKGPGLSGLRKGPTITKITGYVLDSSYTCPDAEKVTITRGPDSTTNRVVCTTLHLLVEEDSADQRFGSTTYKLSNFTGLTKFPFTPTGTLVERPKLGHGGRPGGPGRGV